MVSVSPAWSENTIPPAVEAGGRVEWEGQRRGHESTRGSAAAVWWDVVSRDVKRHRPRSLTSHRVRPLCCSSWSGRVAS